MTISERYKIASINRKKPYKIRFLIIFACLLVAFSFTYSRYTETGTAELVTEVANWQIKINGESISENTPITRTVDLVYTNASGSNVILPGQTGYFDVSIDPDGTEVSIEYEVSIDISHMPNDLTLNGYTINPSTNNSIIDIPVNNTISNEVRLQNNQPLSSSDAVTFRVYWEWEGANEIDEDENYYISTTVIVKQLMNQD